MATLNIGYTFVNATPAVASQVNANFQDVKTFAEGISAGTNIDAGAIELTKLSSNAIQQLTPSGSIMQYGGTAAPTGWILCDGSAVSTTTYAALYAVIGTAFNTSGGQSAPAAGTFRVPLLTGRIPVGRNIADGDFGNIGQTAGEKSVTLTAFQSGLPTHTHAGSNATFTGTAATTVTADLDHVHSFQTSSYGLQPVRYATDGNEYVFTGYGSANTGTMNTNRYHSHSFTATGNVSLSIANAGGTSAADAHTNLQPYIVVNYIIKA